MTILQDISAEQPEKKPAVAAVEKPEAVEAADGSEEQISESELKSMASAKGWVPKKFFKGDPDKWIPAEKFLERAETEMPLMKAANRKLEKQVADMHVLLKRVVSSNKDQADRAVESALAKLKDEKREAVKEGDVDKVEAIDTKIDKVKLKAEKAEDEAPDPKKGEAPPEFAAWVDKNKWFKESVRMRKFAEGVWDELKDEDDFSDLPLEQQLRAITKEVRAQFPDKFGNPKTREAPAVEGGGSAPRGASGKSFDDLPADAKALCDDLVKTKVIKNRADYVKEYFR